MSIYQEHSAELTTRDLNFIRRTINKAKESKTSLLTGLTFSILAPVMIFLLFKTGTFSSQLFTVSLIAFLLVIALIMGYSYFENYQKISFYNELKQDGEKRALTGVITDKRIKSDWNTGDKSGAETHIIELGHEKEIVASHTQFEAVNIGDKVTATFDVTEEFNFLDQDENKKIDQLVKHRKKL
ncbi:MAG: hypothetical protein JJ895_05125 [Balneolaceae bacterium]|nr:hypothetical protein [Balneolaceae bacterium]